jgi:hypothetical protein
MKKALVALALGVGLAAMAFGGSSITISPPVITSWTAPDTVTYTTSSDPHGYLSSLNSNIANTFSTIQNTLNNQYFGKLHDLTDLAKGFANANSAAFDNASLLGYQTYDLFAVMLGFDLGLAVPSTDPTAAQSALNDIVNKGDVYAGLATGGAAGQVGLHLGFINPNLYVTGKFGFIPSMPIGDTSYQQGMFGVGVNYTLFPQIDVLFGFVKWRGLSIGSGFTYNGNSVSTSIPVADQSQQATFNPGTGSVSITATTTNTKAKLSITDSSFVIPIDLMTSIQALWFLNFGLGVGADLSFSSSTVKVGGDSNVDVTGITGVHSTTPGSVVLTASDSSGNGDFFNPRIAASVGLDLALLKIDMPMSYYPLQKAFAWGISGGLVW